MVCTWRLFVNVLFPYEEGLLTNAHICSQNMDSSLIYQLKFVKLGPSAKRANVQLGYAFE